MSISRGRYVATFTRKGDRYRYSEGRWLGWYVCIKERGQNMRDLLFIERYGGKNCSFDDVRKWAIARLDELARERI